MTIRKETPLFAIRRSEIRVLRTRRQVGLVFDNIIMIYPQSTVYALESLRYLAGLPKGTVVKAKAVAVKLDIPEHFLAKILTDLARKKMVSSTKGPNGGVALSIDPKKVTLLKILEALDGLINLKDECVMGLKNCSGHDNCVFHESWAKFKKEILAKSKNMTLADLSSPITDKNEGN